MMKQNIVARARTQKFYDQVVCQAGLLLWLVTVSHRLTSSDDWTIHVINNFEIIFFSLIILLNIQLACFILRSSLTIYIYLAHPESIGGVNIVFE